jgi:hypothetical protein
MYDIIIKSNFLILEGFPTMKTFITPFAALNDAWRVDLAFPGSWSAPKTQLGNKRECTIRFGNYLLKLTNNKAELFVLDEKVDAQIDRIIGDVPDSLWDKLWKQVEVVTSGAYKLDGVCEITKKN